MCGKKPLFLAGSEKSPRLILVGENHDHPDDNKRFKKLVQRAAAGEIYLLLEGSPARGRVSEAAGMATSSEDARVFGLETEHSFAHLSLVAIAEKLGIKRRGAEIATIGFVLHDPLLNKSFEKARTSKDLVEYRAELEIAAGLRRATLEATLDAVIAKSADLNRLYNSDFYSVLLKKMTRALFEDRFQNTREPPNTETESEWIAAFLAGRSKTTLAVGEYTLDYRNLEFLEPIDERYRRAEQETKPRDVYIAVGAFHLGGLYELIRSRNPAIPIVIWANERHLNDTRSDSEKLWQGKVNDRLSQLKRSAN